MFIQNLYLKNFRSIEEETITFEKGIPVLIQGINLTDDGQESNGSGKSTGQIALLYLFTQLIVGKLRAVDLLRRDQPEDAVISSSIVCPIRNEILNVCRKINKKGEGNIKITINGDTRYDSTNGVGTANDANSFLLDWIGITKEDLQNYFIINKERYVSFFYSPNSSKIALVNRFSNADILKMAYDNIKKSLVEIEEKYTSKNNEITSLSGKIEELNEQIQGYSSDDFEVKKQERIQELNNKLDVERGLLVDLRDKKDQFDQAIQDTSKQLEKVKGDIKVLQDKYDSFDIEFYNKKIEGSEKEKQEANATIKEFETELNEINKQLVSVETTLAGSVTCPNCSHEFIPNGEMDPEECRNTKKLLEKSIEELNSDIQEVTSILESINENIMLIETQKSGQVRLRNGVYNEIEQQKRVLSNISSTFISKQNSLKMIEGDIEKSTKDIESLKQDILRVSEEKFDESGITPLKEKLSTYNHLKASLNDEILVIIQQKEKLSKWNLDFKRFEGYLANRSLLSIQSKINDNLKRLECDIRIRLEGFKTKADGSIKEEITPYIIKDGQVVGFGSLSGGEKARVDFANILAIQDIINSTHPHGGLDMLWIDEVLESSDALGLRNMMKSVREFNKSIYITTQNFLNDIKDSTLTFEKINGITRIKQS